MIEPTPSNAIKLFDITKPGYLIMILMITSVAVVCLMLRAWPQGTRSSVWTILAGQKVHLARPTELSRNLSWSTHQQNCILSKVGFRLTLNKVKRRVTFLSLYPLYNHLCMTCFALPILHILFIEKLWKMKKLNLYSMESRMEIDIGFAPSFVIYGLYEC